MTVFMRISRFPDRRSAYYFLMITMAMGSSRP